MHVEIPFDNNKDRNVQVYTSVYTKCKSIRRQTL
jgi:hypothetical protein